MNDGRPCNNDTPTEVAQGKRKMITQTTHSNGNTVDSDEMGVVTYIYGSGGRNGARNGTNRVRDNKLLASNDDQQLLGAISRYCHH